MKTPIKIAQTKQKKLSTGQKMRIINLARSSSWERIDREVTLDSYRIRVFIGRRKGPIIARANLHADIFADGDGIKAYCKRLEGGYILFKQAERLFRKERKSLGFPQQSEMGEEGATA